MALAENISRIQASRGETDYRIAKEIGVTQTSIKNWKSGTKPHPKHLRRLAAYFGVPTEELLDGEPESKVRVIDKSCGFTRKGKL